MSILKVARMGHPVLRSKTRALEKAEIRGSQIQKLIDDMIETMIEYRGVGLTNFGQEGRVADLGQSSLFFRTR